MPRCVIVPHCPRPQGRRSTGWKGGRSIPFATRVSSSRFWSSFLARGTRPSPRTIARCSPRSAGRPRPLCTAPGSSPSWPTRALGSCSRAKRSASGSVATCTTTSPPRSPASAWPRRQSRPSRATATKEPRRPQPDSSRASTPPRGSCAMSPMACDHRCSTTVVSSPQSRSDCRHREPCRRSAWLLRRSAWSCPRRSSPQRCASSRRR